MKKDRQGMKEQLQETVQELKKKGVDFTKDHPLFKWSYPDDPKIEYQLLIMEMKVEKGDETPEIVLH